MEWSGRAPAPPAVEAGRGRQRQGARHVSDTQRHDHRNRHRYHRQFVEVLLLRTAGPYIRVSPY
jgi:hypothetical protein